MTWRARASAADAYHFFCKTSTGAVLLMKESA